MKKIDAYLYKTVRVLTPIVYFLPLVVLADYYFPFITGRNFLFRILISLILAFYLFLFFRNRRQYRPVFSPLILAYLALGLIMTVSSLIAGDWRYSFWGDYERMEGLLQFYYLIAYLIIILGVYYRRQAWRQLVYISTFASFIFSFVALTQILNIPFLLESAGGARVSSTMGNPTYLAAYALFHIFFALYLIFKDKRKVLKFELFGFYVLDLLLIYLEFKYRGAGQTGPLSAIFTNASLLIFFVVPQLLVHFNFFLQKKAGLLARQSFLLYYIILILLNFWALFNTETRGAVVGLFLGVVGGALLVICSGRVSKKIRLAFSGALILLILFLGGIFIFSGNPLIKNSSTLRRIASISLTDVTTESRLLTWQASLKGFTEKPVLGWGEEKFYAVFNKYFPTAIFKDNNSRVWFDRPHNVFLGYLVGGGLLGLLAYLSIYAFVIRRLHKYYKRSGDIVTYAIFIGLLLGYAVQNFFVFDSLNTTILFALYLALVTFITTKPKTELALPRPMRNKWLAYVLPVIVLILGYSFNVPQMKANRELVLNYTALRSSAFDEQQQQDFINAFNKHYLGKFEARQVYSEYVSGMIQNPNLAISDKARLVQLSEEQLLKSMQEQPDNVRHQAFLINLYTVAAGEVSGVYADKNIELIKSAIPLSPNRTTFYYSLGREYMMKNNIDEAIKIFEKARELSPDVFESYLSLLTVDLSAARLEDAQKIIAAVKNKEVFFAGGRQELSPEYYGRLAEVYYFTQYPQEALALLEEAHSFYPDNIPILAQLIVYNNKLGNKAKVDTYIDKLKQINPAMADEARQMIVETNQPPSSKK
ncbi:MAG: hypothetical protein C3F02_03510 [Parcubacteria group bacterium]|nr:MAG: hypothetical protein C3F02_03510 [Parcubacteria group bacterium]